MGLSMLRLLLLTLQLKVRLELIKKKIKTREIEYTYTKSKQDAGRKNALAGVKAKVEDAKSKNIDTTSATFTEETRAMAKRAFKASMAVADIEDAEMEELLKETSKKEASDQLDAAYEMAQSATTDADIRTAFPGAGAKIDAYKTALDTANTKLDTEIADMTAGEAKTAKEAEKSANLAKRANVPAAELKKIKWKCVQDTAKDARMPKKGSIEEVRETNIAADIAAIAALDTAITGMPTSTEAEKAAKATKVAAKATKEA